MVPGAEERPLGIDGRVAVPYPSSMSCLEIFFFCVGVVVPYRHDMIRLKPQYILTYPNTGLTTIKVFLFMNAFLCFVTFYWIPAAVWKKNRISHLG